MVPPSSTEEDPMATQTEANYALQSARSLLITGGIISIIAGIVLLTWPDATITVLAVLLGIDFVLLGGLILVSAFSGETGVGGTILLAILGVLGILAGVAMFAEPARSLAVVLVVVGAFWVVGGVIEIISGIFGDPAESRWLVILSGLLSLVFGIVMLAWPEATLDVLIWLIGIWLLIFGIIRLIMGLTAPKEVADL
jgi:uncharacterized membrane protein HdeD (DUF308 family)